MELGILKLVFDYSKAGKLIDKAYLDKIVEIVVSNRGLHDYVKTIDFTNILHKDSDGVTCASYDFKNKQILIDYESIKCVFDIFGDYYSGLFNGIEQIMYRNIVITQYILHELEHAFQHKKIDSADDSIETKLYRASMILEHAVAIPDFLPKLLNSKLSPKDIYNYLIQHKELYNKFYKFNPAERLAQINSFTTIIKTLEPIKANTPCLYEFNNASMIENMLRGYVESMDFQSSCPTQAYLYGVRMGNIWEGFDFYDKNSNQLLTNVSSKYDVSKRLSLGLPVKESEYECFDNYMRSLNKFNV